MEIIEQIKHYWRDHKKVMVAVAVVIVVVILYVLYVYVIPMVFGVKKRKR